MTLIPESVRDLEEMLRADGAVLTPVEPVREDVQDLQTADGQFQITPARVMGRDENTITLYRTDTAEVISTETNEAVKRLRKRFPDRGSFARSFPQLAGKFTFTLGIRNEMGQYMAPKPILPTGLVGEVCWLSTKSGYFQYTRDLGIRSICESSALRTGLGTEQHIIAKHEGAWPLIARDKADKRDQQDRDRVINLIEMVMDQRGFDRSRAPQVAEAVMAQQTPFVEDAPPAAVPTQPIKTAEEKRVAKEKRERRAKLKARRVAKPTLET